MPRVPLLALACLAFCSFGGRAQVAGKNSVTTVSRVQHALELARKGRCDEALPVLTESAPQLTDTDKDLKYRALMAAEHCAVHKGDGRTTVNALLALRHEYPKDPEVLYLTTQVFLEIAERASRELADVAPNSYQVKELQAETLESQNKWEEAAEIYRKILDENPKLPAIHFRLGRALLSQPETPANVEAARKEFEQELTIDPANASAEFWIGEIARRNGQWDSAITHFRAAAGLDPKLSEAVLALGMALNSAERFSEAVDPLERYTKMAPQDSTGHYQLGITYAHLGRKEDSLREKALVQELSGQPTNAH